jgi:hypothetical protein
VIHIYGGCTFLVALHEKGVEQVPDGNMGVNTLLSNNNVKFYIMWEIYFHLVKFEVFTTDSRIFWVCAKVVIITTGLEERAVSFFRVDKTG